MTNQYFLLAGEISGDLHGSRLMRALNTSSTSFAGVGGPAMRAEGLDCLLPMEEFQLMGFTDVFKSLPKLWKQFYRIQRAILHRQPACVILIDYPGFNLRLASRLRKAGFKKKIVQYICPTVWAHGKKRIRTLCQTMDLLLTIYPFEAEYFAHTSLPVKYIGNPLVEHIQSYPYQNQWKETLSFPDHHPFIAIFPGSRLSEIQRHLPLQLQAATALKSKNPSLRFALSYAQERLIEPIKHIIKPFNLKIGADLYLSPKQFNYELMRDCHTALAKSGTVSLELALHHRPSLIIYQVTWTNYWIAKYLLRLNLPYYCIVNLLGQKEIFPEFVGASIPFDPLFRQFESIYQNDQIRLQMIHDCQRIYSLLGHQSTSRLASQAIQELVLC
jgi:lipid-A-disaccharide synthase